MWIVKIALKRPYTFVVLAILILAMGAVEIFRTPTDIFPNINIPVVSVIWEYNGLVPREMADRIVSPSERTLTTVVDNIEHVESRVAVRDRCRESISAAQCQPGSRGCANYSCFPDATQEAAARNYAATHHCL